MSILDLHLSDIDLIENNLLKLESRLLLKGNLSDYSNNVSKIYQELCDSVTEASIKRFEITFESVMKALKRILGYQNPRIASPVVLLNFMKKKELLEDWLTKWNSISEFRNEMTHEYDQKKVEQWVDKVGTYIYDFKEIILVIKKKNLEI